MIEPTATVYISGPMTIKPGFNFHAFFAMEATLRECFKCKVLNPEKNESGMSYEQYMEIDLGMVRAASHVVLLDDWELSLGALREIEEANKHKKEVIYAKDIMQYLTRQVQTGELTVKEG